VIFQFAFCMFTRGYPLVIKHGTFKIHENMDFPAMVDFRRVTGLIYAINGMPFGGALGLV